MSGSDAARPTRATGEEYADALSGLVEKKSGRSSTGPEPRHGGTRGSGNSNPFHVFLLVVALAGLIGWNVYYLTQPVEPGSPELQRRAASVKLYHAVQAVEAHRARTGALPEDLASLNVPIGDYEYVPADTGYTLALRTQDTYNQYRSGTDPQELVRRAGIAGRGDRGGGEGAEPGEGSGTTEGTEGTEGTGGEDADDGNQEG